MPEQKSKIPFVEHHSITVVPVTNVVPVSQVPVVTQLPVTRNSFTHTRGFPVSPLNLTDIAFDTPSHNGSNSGYLAKTVQLHAQPQLQL